MAMLSFQSLILALSITSSKAWIISPPSTVNSFGFDSNNQRHIPPLLASSFGDPYSTTPLPEKRNGPKKFIQSAAAAVGRRVGRIGRGRRNGKVYASVSATPEWKKLFQHTKHIKSLHLRDLLNDPIRCGALRAEFDGILLDYSRSQVTVSTMKLLVDLAKRQGLEAKISSMFNGDRINKSENRSVLHVATRANSEDAPIIVDGVNVIELVKEQQRRVESFSEGIRRKQILGYTGRPIRNIVSVGIGGSYLGPEFVNEVLATDQMGIYTSQGITLRFLSNVDPVAVERVVSELDAEETLVVVVSKTFSTAETMRNARTMRQWLWDRMTQDGKPNANVTAMHMVACASQSASKRVAAFGIGPDRFFKFWDWVGGRYSVCSSAGIVPLSIKYSYEVIDKMLQGARSMDIHFRSAPFHANLPVLLGLIGVWNLSFLGYKSRIMLPYSEALCKFPAHIQQVDMESNGKRVTLEGKVVDYDVGEVDFGESGTNSQHSFFQLLHLGQPVPCDFIGFVEAQNNLVHTEGEDLSCHDELMSNFFAQPDALAIGRSAEELIRRDPSIPKEVIPHRVFPGNRPSSSLLFPQLTAYTVGQMLALYEHRTAVEGFIWNINSFDQMGVELGKTLATDVRNQLKAAREEDIAPANFNPSTLAMLKRYLSGEGGYAEEWQKAPPALRQEVRRRRFSFYHGTKKLFKSSRRMGGSLLKAGGRMLSVGKNRNKTSVMKKEHVAAATLDLDSDNDDKNHGAYSTKEEEDVKRNSQQKKKHVQNKYDDTQASDYFNAFKDEFPQKRKFGKK